MIVISETKKVISSALDVVDVMKSVYAARHEEDQHKEFCYILGLNSSSQLLYVDLIAMGTINWCSPITREALRLAVVKHASAVIAVHNHPSGNVLPSPEDRTFTKILCNGGKILNVKVLDHIIISGDKYYSFGDKSEI